jgi:uncharacterized protein (TIGR00730 family)
VSEPEAETHDGADAATATAEEPLAARVPGGAPPAGPPTARTLPPAGRARFTTGDPTLDERIDAVLDALPAQENRDQVLRLLVASAAMPGDGADRLDLKIAASALEEMRSAAKTFAPYRGRKKLTIFGSARTLPSDPLYEQTRQLAARMAGEGWMVVTGGGPGIMSAGLQGAGRPNAIGVTIKLPFESPASEYLDPGNVVEMKYFFTRKLALVRESDAFVVMPGGFGTLDEAFELLTLLQTGKASPVPIVLLGLGQGYWHGWEGFVETVVRQGYAAPDDEHLYRITNDVDMAVQEICGFYANYHSIRWVGKTLVIRLHRAPTPERLADLSAEFLDLCGPAGLQASRPLPPEVVDGDHLDLARVRFRYGGRAAGRLRLLIDALNQS